MSCTLEAWRFANLRYSLITVVVSKGHMEGIHSIVIRSLVPGMLVLMVGDVCDTTVVLEGYQNVHDNPGLTIFRIAYFIMWSQTQP